VKQRKSTHLLKEMFSMKQIKKALQVILPLCLAAFMFWLVYKDWDFTVLADVFTKGAHYEWFAVSILLSGVSVALRGLRWKLLLDPVCPGSRKNVAILSIFVGYAANMLLPRAGEIARCGVLKKVDGISFTKSLGTVITERVFDVFSLLIITLITVLLQMEVFRDFLYRNPESVLKLKGILTSPFLWGGFVGLVILSVVLWNFFKRAPLFVKIREFLFHLWLGMKSITTIKHPFLFVVYTIGLWGCYFLMFFVVKYFFDWNMNVGVLALLSGFVMGSFGVVAPVQGGIGAYHFMVIYTLVFFGVSTSDAGIFALVAHGLQTIFTLVSGLVAYLLVLCISKKNDKLVAGS
jgi:glycosyltransferase 2 family protein